MSAPVVIPTDGELTYISNPITPSATSITVASTAGFTSSGTLAIGGPVYWENVSYSGITSRSFTGLTRGSNAYAWGAGAAIFQTVSAGGAGSGTVTSVSVTTANGVSGSVATATSTPAISLTLGAITPSSVVSSGSVTGTNLSGTNTGDNATNTQYSGLAASKQDVLVSGTNIKTINSTSLLGAGDIAISGSGLTQSQVEGLI